MTTAVSRGEPAADERAATRRAWTLLGLSSLVFAVLLLSSLRAGQYVLDHATTSRDATAIVISGTGALWRSGEEGEWRLFDGRVVLSEGDEISTELGTVVWLTFFDGSTLEISERSRVSLQRLRTTRFRPTTKQIVVRVFQGAIHGAMAPRGDYHYAEIEVVSDAGRALMVDEPGLSQAGAFLVDVVDPPAPNVDPLRVAIFRGQIRVYSDRGEHLLEDAGQVTVSSAGRFSPSNDIVRELIVNGDFESDLEGWEAVYTAAGREPESEVGRAELVEVGSDGVGMALTLVRDGARMAARTGVRQRVERTLRLPTSLTLSFDLRIDHQGQAMVGSGTIPLGIELSYIDILGQERVWRTGYVVRQDDAVLDADVISVITPDTWTHVIFDLNELEPIPKFLRSVVVYASGTSYQAMVSNLSLTTRESGSRSP